MSDEPTPRTDDYCEPWTIGKTPQNFAIDCESGRICLIPDDLGHIAELIASAPVMARRIEQLERELAEAREQCTLIASVAVKTIAQRDRLAEALRNIKINAVAIQQIRWGHDGDCGAKFRAELIEGDCEQALAAVEGGKHNAEVSRGDDSATPTAR